MKRKALKIFASMIACVMSIFVFCGCFSQNILKSVSKNLSEYEIDVSLDKENMTLSGKEKIKVVNKTEVSLNSLCFNFYARAFDENSAVKPYTVINEGKVFPNGVDYGSGTIQNAQVNAKPVAFKYVDQNSTAFEISLENLLEPGENVQVEIDFQVKLANSTHRLGYFNGSVNLGNFFPILAVYENGSFVTHPYYSTGDPFYSELANYKVNFECSKDYNFCSSGELLKKEERQENVKYFTKAIAVRDFAINLSKNSKTVSQVVNNVQISYTGYDKDENLDQNLQIAVKAFNYYSKAFGKYPYKTLSVVKAPFVHGGMEYPCMVVLSDSIFEQFDQAKVIVHEIAHQWWYAMVGNNQITEAWLDESLAEFSSVMFFENHPEFEASYEELVSEAFSIYTLYADIVKSTSGQIKTSMLLPVNEYNSEYEYSYMIYVKGILMFDALRQTIGKGRLEECLKKYFNEFKFKTVTTDEFIEFFKKCSKRDVEGFFDSWLQGKTIIGAV